MNTGNKTPIVDDERSSFTQSSMSSPLVFDPVIKRVFVPPLNDFISLRIVDYDAHISAKIEFSINYFFNIYDRSRTEDSTSYLWTRRNTNAK